ncbi:hypothetical protein Pcinc_026220 [Petrolisthes cinctipes]|uniref:Uncharacterized protein n=1 Tax=Petrolisthes cinctipes TaxID=88211 RepID=A0AAE1F6J3_PETCI|nr:hypothetical protein Pcinc_026220 [Petrolisthes cinctipes]
MESQVMAQRLSHKPVSCSSLPPPALPLLYLPLFLSHLLLFLFHLLLFLFHLPLFLSHLLLFLSHLLLFLSHLLLFLLPLCVLLWTLETGRSSSIIGYVKDAASLHHILLASLTSLPIPSLLHHQAFPSSVFQSPASSSPTSDLGMPDIKGLSSHTLTSALTSLHSASAFSLLSLTHISRQFLPLLHIPSVPASFTLISSSPLSSHRLMHNFNPVFLPLTQPQSSFPSLCSRFCD